MPLDKGLLVLRLKNQQKNLKVWHRVLINLYILGGYETPIKITTLRDACYNGKLTPHQRDALYGTIWKTAEKLRIDGNLKRYNNPVRYQLVYSRRVAGFLAMVAKRLGFPNARMEDFL